jgi:hypothetical protein
MCRCVRGFLRNGAWAAALTVALFSASPSKAGTLTVDFDLAPSTLAIGTLINVSNGMNGTVSGAARLVLTGVNAMGMITGGMANGTISGLGLNIGLNANVAGVATVTGTIGVTQVGSATGAFDGMGVSLPTNSFNNMLSTNLDCTPAAICNAVAMFPIVTNTMIANNMGPFVFSTAGLGGGASINAAVMVMQAGQNVTLSFRGSEVARTFDAGPGGGPQVPEPVEAGLLILGVLSLCGVAAVRRQTA